MQTSPRFHVGCSLLSTGRSILLLSRCLPAHQQGPPALQSVGMHLALASCAPNMRLQSALPSSGGASAAVAPKARLKDSRRTAPPNLVAKWSQPLLGQRVVCWYTPFFMLVDTCAELILDSSHINHSSHTNHNSHTNHSKILHTDSSQDSLAGVRCCLVTCRVRGVVLANKQPQRTQRRRWKMQSRNSMSNKRKTQRLLLGQAELTNTSST